MQFTRMTIANTSNCERLCSRAYGKYNINKKKCNL